MFDQYASSHKTTYTLTNQLKEVVIIISDSKLPGIILLSTMSSFEFFALLVSTEIDNKYDELQALIDLNHSVLQSTVNNNGNRKFPIHVACSNPHATLRIVQLLLNGWPESISHQNQLGRLPLHCLCANKDLDEAVAVRILAVLLEAFPESVQREDSTFEDLPIHVAARWGMSPEFLKILVDAHPESVRIPYGADRVLPIHLACNSVNCRLDSVKYLLDIYPESINIEADICWWPIHHAAFSKGSQKSDIIKYLLMKDPTCASKAVKESQVHNPEDAGLPLHFACNSGDNNLSAVQVLFNAYPEAILEEDGFGSAPLERARGEGAAANVIAFLEAQLVYAKKSQDVSALFPLHHSLKNNASLGSIKLLVKGNTSAIRIADNNMALPLHIACGFNTIEVVKYLMEMLDDDHIWNHLDSNDDSILHYACRGGNCEVVKYLLDKQSRHVSKHNTDKKLPIHLLCQFGLPANSLEHTDIVFRLLLACPETL